MQTASKGEMTLESSTVAPQTTIMMTITLFFIGKVIRMRMIAQKTF